MHKLCINCNNINVQNKKKYKKETRTEREREKKILFIYYTIIIQSKLFKNLAVNHI